MSCQLFDYLLNQHSIQAPTPAYLIMKQFYGHSLSRTVSKRLIVGYWRKCMHFDFGQPLRAKPIQEQCGICHMQVRMCACVSKIIYDHPLIHHYVRPSVSHMAHPYSHPFVQAPIRPCAILSHYQMSIVLSLPEGFISFCKMDYHNLLKKIYIYIKVLFVCLRLTFTSHQQLRSYGYGTLV